MSPLDTPPAQFRHLAHRISGLAADYLEELDSASAYHGANGPAVEQVFRSPLPEAGLGEESFNLLAEVAKYSRKQNGRFFGYVLGSGEPVGAVADLLASVLNQNVTAWRSGPAAVTIEQTVVNWLATAIGCPAFSGSLTGGGSSANLMGLAMAREAKIPANESGVAKAQQGTIYASEEIHMSIPKAVALLGIGRDNLRLIPTDESFRIRPDALEQAMVRDKSAGCVPVAVVASAGTVNVGAIDPLREVADIAQRHGAWFHVDGAYGALASMADGSKFAGLELADSLSLDPHKWLYQPLDCGCLLFRDAKAAQKAFSHSGDYAKSLTNDPIEGFAFFEESLELSRRFRALKLWLSIRYHGMAAFREAIRNDMAHAQRLAEAIGREPLLELLAPVELSAVCFRYRGKSARRDGDLNRLNADILQRLVQRGRVYLSNAVLRGRFCLRACIVNHRTTDADVDRIIPEVLEVAAQVGA